MGNKKQRREDKLKRNTALIEASGFNLHYFSDIHVRIDDRVDFWLSTGTWHVKNQKSESKCYDEMIEYLGGKMNEDYFDQFCKKCYQQTCWCNKPKNKLINIGGINNYIYYLNVSREEAILRYSKEWEERGMTEPPEYAEVYEHEFNDSFTFDDIN